MGNIIINKIRRHWHMIKVCTSQPSSSMSPNTLNIFDFWLNKRRRHRQRLKQEKALLANTFSTSPSKTATELSVSSVKFRTRSWTTNSRSSNSSNNANRRKLLAPRFTRHVQRVKECIVCQLAIFAIAHSVWLLHVNRATNVLPRNRLPTPQHQIPTTNCEPWEHIASVGCCCRSSSWRAGGGGLFENVAYELCEPKFEYKFTPFSFVYSTYACAGLGVVGS